MQNKKKWHGLSAGIAHKNIYKLLHSVEKMIVKNLRSKKISRTKKQSKKKESAHIKSPNF